MSDDYIKREDAIKDFKAWHEFYKDATIPTDIARRDEITAMIGALIKIPSADVREVVHGENIGTDYAECDQFICSECGIHLQGWVRIDEDDYDDGIVYEYEFRFCPNCGAKMFAKDTNVPNKEGADDE